MRRIRNITDEPLSVPLLGVIVQPGDVANVPDALDVEFSENYWEMDGTRDGGDVVATDTGADVGEVRDVAADDAASAIDAHEGSES